ncbi:MAG: dTMP kinase [Puniceicoccales bacterium]|jgi:dTMP kinase|nr:dTMP kinase [Puniceicoccales bacterium]
MGIFVTFEGMECCGKSTQLHLLARWLRERGHDAIETREPGGTDIGESIRELLRSGNVSGTFSSRAEILLFEASRAQHMEEKILPAIAAGKIVLCDRFHDSTTVYQGVARAVDADAVSFLNGFASHGRVPDMTILLDIGVRESFRRMDARGAIRDRIESEDENFFQKVRDGYRMLAEDVRFFTVDGMSSIAEIHGKIRDEFARRFF